MNELGWRILIGVLCFFAGAIVYILSDQFHAMETKHKEKAAMQEAYISRVNRLCEEVESLTNKVDDLEWDSRANRPPLYDYRNPEAYERHDWGKSMHPANIIEKRFSAGEAKHAKAD